MRAIILNDLTLRIIEKCEDCSFKIRLTPDIYFCTEKGYDISELKEIAEFCRLPDLELANKIIKLLEEEKKWQPQDPARGKTFTRPPAGEDPNIRKLIENWPKKEDS